MRKKYILLLFITAASCWCQVARADTLPFSDPPVTSSSAKKKKSQKEPSGLNLKLAPAFFWNTAGLEVEVPIATRFTLALSGYGKLGRTDNAKRNYRLAPEKHLENGYMVELAARYYPTTTPKPAGFYAQLAFNYGNLLYFDGTTRPFCINQRWREIKNNNLRNRTELTDFQPYGVAIGGGYQITFKQRRIIAHLGGGLQGNIPQQGGLNLFIYLTPSVGLLF